MDRRETLVVPGIEEDPRFAGSILRDHGARSGLTVPVHASDRGEAPYAALGAHWRTLRPASVDDVHFLQTLANVVAAAISRHKMEEQLRAAERQAQEERIRTNQAQEAIRERDEFISIAAHELRTPLAALQLKVQGLERVLRKTGGNFQDPALDSRLQGAVRQTHRLGALVERLLDISRIASGRLDLTIEEFDLSRLLEQVVEDFREPASQAGSPLRVTAPPSLRGSWDRFRIEQVLVNLLSNAVKYGGGHPIDLRVEEKDGRVELAVVDRGIGIPSSAVDRIFARFERAAPLQNYGGMGLGLYITRHIVEAHGGSVRVSTKEGEGSTFTVDLPVSRADSLAPASKSRYADV
jgi:signal transduction histidine kinase